MNIIPSRTLVSCNTSYHMLVLRCYEYVIDISGTTLTKPYSDQGGRYMYYFARANPRIFTYI